MHQRRRIAQIFLTHYKSTIMFAKNAICHLLARHLLKNTKTASTLLYEILSILYQTMLKNLCRCLEMNVLASCGSWFRCPLCSLTYCDANLMSLHINKTHRDVLKSNLRATSQRRANNRNSQTSTSSRSFSSPSEHHHLRKFSWNNKYIHVFALSLSVYFLLRLFFLHRRKSLTIKYKFSYDCFYFSSLSRLKFAIW